MLERMAPQLEAGGEPAAAPGLRARVVARALVPALQVQAEVGHVVEGDSALRAGRGAGQEVVALVVRAGVVRREEPLRTLLPGRGISIFQGLESYRAAVVPGEVILVAPTDRGWNGVRNKDLRQR